MPTSRAGGDDRGVMRTPFDSNEAWSWGAPSWPSKSALHDFGTARSAEENALPTDTIEPIPATKRSPEVARDNAAT